MTDLIEEKEISVQVSGGHCKDSCWTVPVIQKDKASHVNGLEPSFRNPSRQAEQTNVFSETPSKKNGYAPANNLPAPPAHFDFKIQVLT